MCNPIGIKYTFDAMEPEKIFQAICAIVENDQDVKLTVGKTATSILFYGEKVFGVRINSKTQCLDTIEECAIPYASRIVGAKLIQTDKQTSMQIPLVTDEASVPAVHDMLRELFQECFNRQNVEKFGCCNDHVRCSDARRCLHEGDKFYLGCIYRENLEAGRIFYGKNRNVEEGAQ